MFCEISGRTSDKKKPRGISEIIIAQGMSGEFVTKPKAFSKNNKLEGVSAGIPVKPLKSEKCLEKFMKKLKKKTRSNF